MSSLIFFKFISSFIHSKTNLALFFKSFFEISLREISYISPSRSTRSYLLFGPNCPSWMCRTTGLIVIESWSLFRDSSSSLTFWVIFDDFIDKPPFISVFEIIEVSRSWVQRPYTSIWLRYIVIFLFFFNGNLTP